MPDRLKPAKPEDFFTLPGVLAHRLYNQYGLGRRFAPVAAWYVDNNVVRRVEIVELVSADSHYNTADYAVTTTGVRLPALYLFPVARHRKPTLQTINDDYGSCQQWVAVWKKNVIRPWD